MMYAAAVAGGAILGGIAAWLYLGMRLSAINARNGELERQAAQKAAECERLNGKLLDEARARTEAANRLEQAGKSLEEERKGTEALKDAFSALSQAALKSSSEDFLRLANENLGRMVEDTKGKLSEHQAAMGGLLKPLQESLKKFEEQIQQIEVKRKADYTNIESNIKTLETASRELRKETLNLSTALRKPHVRGRWLEVQLRRVVEMAGMLEHCDFEEQVDLSTEGGRLRPDMEVKLPGGRSIVVDAKCSMEAFIEAQGAATEEERKAGMERHARHVREQVDRLANKKYWEQFRTKTPELAVLFISESALAAAFEINSTLLEDSLSKKVVIATPTTLFALLTAVAYGWRQEGLAENAEKIGRMGKELFDRVATFCKNFSSVGANLDRSITAYNAAVGSLETRVLPSVKKFRELGVAGGEMQEPEKIEKMHRPLTLYE